jgi:hypothetical protein
VLSRQVKKSAILPGDVRNVRSVDRTEGWPMNGQTPMDAGKPLKGEACGEQNQTHDPVYSATTKSISRMNRLHCGGLSAQGQGASDVAGTQRTQSQVAVSAKNRGTCG